MDDHVFPPPLTARVWLVRLPRMHSFGFLSDRILLSQLRASLILFRALPFGV